MEMFDFLSTSSYHFLAFELLLYLYPIQVCIPVKQIEIEIYQFLTGKQVSWYQTGTVVSECHGMSCETEMQFLLFFPP